MKPTDRLQSLGSGTDKHMFNGFYIARINIVSRTLIKIFYILIFTDGLFFA